MSNIQRINDMQLEVSAIVNQRIQAVLGTDQEPDLLGRAMESGLKVLTALRDLVAAGMTYELWHEYFMNETINNEFINSLENEAGDIKRIALELQGMDMTEWYTKMIEGQVTMVELDHDVKVMTEHLSEMREIWAEEAKEAELAPA